MNDGYLTLAKTPRTARFTARGCVVATLAKEILGHPQTNAFRIDSEHQLCRRFNVSRVTVRLALADLENRGLIFRKHGRGTFAHGRATGTPRSIAVLLSSSSMTEKKAMFNMIRGVLAMVTSIGSAMVLIGTSPQKWSAELASTLGGVMVISEKVTPEDIESLKNRKLPFLILGETHLRGPRILLDPQEFTNYKATARSSLGDDFFTIGYTAAVALSRAAMTGESLSDLCISKQRFSFNLGLIATEKP